MRVAHISALPEGPRGQTIPIAGWTGGWSHEHFGWRAVNFGPGATTGLHAQTCDQILIIIHGTDIVATEHEAHEVTVGDIVHIEPVRNHWHGAKQDTTMSHMPMPVDGSQRLR